MRILFLSRYGEGVDVAFRMILDGHQVRVWIEDEKCRDNGDGLVPKVADWKGSAAWAQLAVFDYNSKGLAEVYKQLRPSVPCFGGSPFAFQLEDDRAFARQIMTRAGLPVLESNTFRTLKEAHAHLREHKVAHVVKPMGVKVDKHHLVIGSREDNADALAQVERLMDSGLPVDAVEVEERKRGVEVGLSGWFNGRDWLGPVNLNFEHKRSHDREIGYLTGECGTLCRYVDAAEVPLFAETLDRLKPLLKAADYRGQMDVNMIVGRDPETHERFVAPLELTPRLGYPAWALEDELHVTPWADLLGACARGEKRDVQVRYDWAVGVVLCAFGFPFADKVETASKGLVVDGLTEENLDHVHPMNLKLDKKGRFAVSSGAGYVLVATGRGESIDAAKGRAYSNLGALTLPNGFHRWDIGDKVHPWELEDLGILSMAEARP